MYDTEEIEQPEMPGSCLAGCYFFIKMTGEVCCMG
jgi:hypothetical protein